MTHTYRTERHGDWQFDTEAQCDAFAHDYENNGSDETVAKAVKAGDWPTFINELHGLFWEQQYAVLDGNYTPTELRQIATILEALK